MKRIAVWMLAFALLAAGTAIAERMATLENLRYGEDAFSLHMRDEVNTLVFDGVTYELEDDKGSFVEAFNVYGGKTRAAHEITIPKERYSVEPDGQQLLLGTLVIDVPYKTELYICDGNRVSGEFAVSGPITLTDLYEEPIYMQRNASGQPVVTDRYYLYSYELGGETVHRAISLYIDYEGCRARHLGTLTPVLTAEPTATPTTEPTATPTVEPTATPTVEPIATPAPMSDEEIAEKLMFKVFDWMGI